jgi:hypothetical protein
MASRIGHLHGVRTDPSQGRHGLYIETRPALRHAEGEGPEHMALDASITATGEYETGGCIHSLSLSLEKRFSSR